MIPVDSQTMREVAPHFSGEWADRQAKIISEVGEVLRPTLEGFDITTALRIAHFLGQTCEELAGFRTTEEFASGEEYENRADLGNTILASGKAQERRMNEVLKPFIAIQRVQLPPGKGQPTSRKRALHGVRRRPS